MINNQIVDVINKAKEEISFMIKKMEEQDITNFGLLYSLENLIYEVEAVIFNDRKAPPDLIDKWNYITGYIFRALEGSNLQELLDIIENYMKNRIP